MLQKEILEQKAFWKNGYIRYWDYENNQWMRYSNIDVALKSLNNSKDITLEFLSEVMFKIQCNLINVILINI